LARETGRLCGYRVTPRDWTFHAEKPWFVLEDGDWEELFPDMAADPGLDNWRQAWVTWGQVRNLPGAELQACALERRGIRLCARVGKRLMDRLRSSRTDALKGPSLILAGHGAMRPCAVLEVGEYT